MTLIAGLTLTGAAKESAPADRTVDFRRLLGEAAWGELPAAVRRRFDAEAGRHAHDYDGAMEVRANLFGYAFAQICRLIGTPLAPWRGRGVPVRVAVRPAGGGALIWARTYHFPGRKPLLVSSAKVLDETGRLMEVARGGLGMRLQLSVEDGALHFRSTGYFLKLGGIHLPIAGWFTPGAAHVSHQDLGGGAFRFTLTFIHPLLGQTLYQTGIFRDPAPVRE